MAVMGVSVAVFIGISLVIDACLAQESCGDLWCEQGHCCGSDGIHCCTYYYELWWFWMIWGLIIMLSCCCLYQQHRMKKRQRLALRALQTRFQDPPLSIFPITTGHSSALAYQESRTELRLPSYDEVQDLPKDPPAYEILYEDGPQPIDSSRQASNSHASPVCTSDSVPQNSIAHIDHRDEAGLLANEALPVDDPPPSYSVSVVPGTTVFSHQLETGRH